MSVQEQLIPVLHEDTDTEHVDSPKPKPSDLPANVLPETVAAKSSDDATPATVDVSSKSAHEDMPSISLEAPVNDVIPKEAQDQVGQDASIINEAETHEYESAQSNADDIVVYNVSKVLDSGVDHDKVGSDDTTVESATDDSTTDVEAVVAQPETKILDKADIPVVGNGGHVLQVEAANNDHGEAPAATELLVDLSSTETHPFAADSSPTEELGTVDPANEPAVENMEIAEPPVDTQPESVAELVAPPVASALVDVESTRDVSEPDEEIVFAPGQPASPEHVVEPEVDFETAKEALILEDLSTEVPVEISEDNVRAAEHDGDNTIPVIDSGEVAVEGLVDPELPIAEAVSGAVTPTEQSVAVDSEPTRDSIVEVPAELVIVHSVTKEAELSADDQESRYTEVTQSTEESESLADLSLYSDIPVFVESSEPVEGGVNVPILDVHILEEAEKNEPLESGEEIFSPLEAEIEFVQSVKVPTRGYEDEVTESESKESLGEHLAVDEPAEGFSAEIPAALPVDDVASPIREDIVQSEIVTNQAPVEEVPADMPVVEPAQEEALAPVLASVPVVDETALVEPEAETAPDAEPESTKETSQVKPVSVVESVPVEDEVPSELVETITLPVEYVGESEPKENLQAMSEETEGIPTSDDHNKTIDPSTVHNDDEISDAPAAVEIEKFEEIPVGHTEGVLLVETGVIPTDAEGLKQEALVESQGLNEHPVADGTLPIDNASVPALDIPHEETGRPKSPWTPSYSVNTQGGSSDNEEVEDLPPAIASASIEVPEVVEASVISIPEDTVLVKTEVEKIPPVHAEGLQQLDVDIPSEPLVEVTEATRSVNDSDVQPNIDSEQADVDSLAIRETEDSIDERPKSPWTPSYSVTTLHGSSRSVEPNAELEEDAERLPLTSAHIPEQDVVLEALPTASQPQPNVLVAESFDEQPAGGVQTTSETADILDDELKPGTLVVESSAAEQEVDSVPVEINTLTLPVAVADLPEDQPKSPWTPSYSVTTLRELSPGVDSKPEDITEAEDLEQLPAPVSSSVIDEPAEDVTEDKPISQGDVQANEEATAAPDGPAVVESDVQLLSDVRESEQDVHQETKLDIPDVPKRPWTPSYSSYTQGSGVTGDADEDKDSINSEPVEPQAGISVDTEESSREGPPAEDSSHAEATEAQDFPRIDDSLDTLPKKHELKALQPVDPSSSMLSSRSRYESTTSSRFFPGGWFSSTPKSPQDEGRASLDEAVGEFIPSKAATAPQEPIVEETSEEQTVEEKKSRWCTIM